MAKTSLESSVHTLNLSSGCHPQHFRFLSLDALMPWVEAFTLVPLRFPSLLSNCLLVHLPILNHISFLVQALTPSVILAHQRIPTC